MDKTAQWLEIVAKDHNKWIEIANKLGEYNYSEDVVQECYIVLYKYTNENKVIKNGKINEGYMFFVIRSVLFQFYNSKKKIKMQSIDDDRFFEQIPNECKMNEQIAYNDFCKLLDKKASTFNWYDQKLWKLYSQTDMSIRKIAAETKISWVSIFNSLKNIKNELRQELGEDYLDFKNQDYENLK